MSLLPFDECSSHISFRIIIFNTLTAITVLCLTIASSRDPGSPDQSLAPHTSHRSTAHDTLYTTIGDQAGVSVDEDDIPLRYLRNSQWVNSRVAKDRPSPLPLNPTRTAAGGPTSDDSDESDSSALATVSTFPFGASPFIPSSATDAGQAEDELNEDKTLDPFRPDHREAEVANEEVTGVKDPLLISAPAYRSRREIGEKALRTNDEREGRWCKKCDAWKPDRCHHCRYCRRCILKSEDQPIDTLAYPYGWKLGIMSANTGIVDHHCPWIGTCVGYNNCPFDVPLPAFTR